jgi:threonine synthase
VVKIFTYRKNEIHINKTTRRNQYKNCHPKRFSGRRRTFMPEYIPKLDSEFFENLSNFTLQEIGFRVAKEFLGESISDENLKEIIDEVLNFEIPA